jgi:hypothetical protein
LVWTEYFEGDFSNRRGKARNTLMRKYKLLQRDIDEFEGKHVTKAALDLSPVSDTGDDDVLNKDLDHDAVIKDTSPVRSSSPWESDVDLFKSKSNTSTPVRDEWSPSNNRSSVRLPDMSQKRKVDLSPASSNKRCTSPFSSRLNITDDKSMLKYQNPSLPFTNAEPPLPRRSASPRGEKRKHDGLSDISSKSTGGSEQGSVLETLKLLSALEHKYLSQFGAKIDQLLALAITKENQTTGLSYNMIHDKECYKLMAKSHEKLQAILQDPKSNLTEGENKVFRIVLNNLVIFKQRTSLKPQDIEDKESIAEKDRLLKMAIARTINEHLTKEGKSVTDDQFSFLIEAEFKRVKQMQITGESQPGPSKDKSSASQHTPSSRPRSESQNSGQFDEPVASGSKQQPMFGQPLPSGQEDRYSLSGSSSANHSDRRSHGRDPRPSHYDSRPSPDPRSPNLDPRSPHYDPRSTNPDPRSSYYDSRSSRYDPRSSRDPDPRSFQYDPRSTNQEPRSSYNDPRSSSNDPRSSSNDPRSSRDPRASQYDPRSSHYDPRSPNQDPRPSHSDSRSSKYEPGVSHYNPRSRPDPRSSHHDPRSSQDPRSSHAPRDARLSGPNPYTDPIPSTSHQQVDDDVFIDFTDEELISLLTNFKTLEPLEQKDLICHMKKLETDNPDRVKRLKEAMHKR